METIKIISDNTIALQAKKLYPYNDDDNNTKKSKISSKRKRFIEGAKWMRNELQNK